VPSPLGGAMHLLKVRHSLHWTAITLSLASPCEARREKHSPSVTAVTVTGTAVRGRLCPLLLLRAMQRGMERVRETQEGESVPALH
jgi:hypothetical protein